MPLAETSVVATTPLHCCESNAIQRFDLTQRKCGFVSNKSAAHTVRRVDSRHSYRSRCPPAMATPCKPTPSTVSLPTVSLRDPPSLPRSYDGYRSSNGSGGTGPLGRDSRAESHSRRRENAPGGMESQRRRAPWRPRQAHPRVSQVRVPLPPLDPSLSRPNRGAGVFLAPPCCCINRNHYGGRLQATAHDFDLEWIASAESFLQRVVSAPLKLLCESPCYTSKEAAAVSQESWSLRLSP